MACAEGRNTTQLIILVLGTWAKDQMLLLVVKHGEPGCFNLGWHVSLLVVGVTACAPGNGQARRGGRRLGGTIMLPFECLVLRLR